MTGSNITVEEAAQEWMKDPEFRAEYDALEDEFALASALIKARGEAHLTQEQVAKAMGTSRPSSPGWRVVGHCPRPAHWNGSPRRPIRG